MRRTSSDVERGSATVEFISIGVLLIVPLVYFVITMGRIQAAGFAADGSAREAARAFVTAANDEDGFQRAAIAVRLGLQDQGFNPDDADLAMDCAGRVCLTPGGRVVARVRVRVALPGVPAFIDRAVSTSITVRSSQTAAVDRFRSTDVAAADIAAASGVGR